MTSPAQWFYTDPSGGQRGPVSFEQIQQWAANGQLPASTLLWTDGMPAWTPISRVNGLTSPSPVPPPNPYAPPVQNQNYSNGVYPIPQVKRTSFRFFLSAHLLSILFAIVAFTMVTTLTEVTEERSDEQSEFNQQHAEAGTPEELLRVEARRDEIEPTAVTGSELSGGIGFFVSLALAIFFSTIAGIYGLVILHRAWRVLQPGGAQTTPGQAVGYLFIPLFSLYWIFVAYPGWARDWNRIRSSYDNLASAPPASRGLFLTALICMFTVIGAPIGLICIFLMNRQMCRAINFMARTSAA